MVEVTTSWVVLDIEGTTSSTESVHVGLYSYARPRLGPLIEKHGDETMHNRHVGELKLADAIDRFYTADVFMHTWDLARGLGKEPNLDEARCAEALAGMEPIDEMLRASGQYGPRVPVPDDASAQDRLMGFIGRDPNWRRP